LKHLVGMANHTLSQASKALVSIHDITLEVLVHDGLRTTVCIAATFLDYVVWSSLDENEVVVGVTRYSDHVECPLVARVEGDGEH
jgi:hypothetical protein